MNVNYSTKTEGPDFKVYLDMSIPESQRTTIRRYFGEDLMALSPMIFSIRDPECLEAEIKTRWSSTSTLILYLLESYDEKWAPVCKETLKTIGNVLIFAKRSTLKGPSQKVYAGLEKRRDKDFFGLLNFHERKEASSIFSCFSGCGSHPDDYKRTFAVMSCVIFDAVEKLKENKPKRTPDTHVNIRAPIKWMSSRPTAGPISGKDDLDSASIKEKSKKTEDQRKKGNPFNLEKPRMNNGLKPRDDQKIEFTISGIGSDDDREPEEKKEREEKRRGLGPVKFEEKQSHSPDEKFLDDESVGQISLSIKAADS